MPRLGEDFFQALLRNVRYQRLAHAGGVDAHAASDPRVHANESRRLDFLNVDGFAAVEDREMAGEAGLLHQVAHDRAARLHARQCHSERRG